MKRPLSPSARLLGRNVVEVLLITISGLEKRFQVVLLHFLSNDLLQRLRLEHLIGLLLGAQFNQ